jgi:hypothetical protein
MRDVEQLSRPSTATAKRDFRPAAASRGAHETSLPPTQREILALQRTAGNAAVCQLMEDRAAATGEGSMVPVQRGFFDDVGNFFKGAAKAVGSAVSGAARDVGNFVSGVGRGIGKIAGAVGSALSGAAKWVYARFGDAAHWLVDLFKNLPERLMRFGKAIAEGLAGVASFIPEAIGALIHGGISGFGRWLWEKAKSGAAWVGKLVSRVFDLIGGPELVEFVLHVVSNATPLSSTERAAAQSVLGTNALSWDEVRIDQGGLLGLIFKFNQGRAFTTFHSINMTAVDRADLSIVVHELTHVDQYEHAGSIYIGQALGDQIAEGAHAYDYGGPSGLKTDRAAGKHYADYGRERQAQIAQDYYRDITKGTATTDYDPYIAELRKGEL